MDDERIWAWIEDKGFPPETSRDVKSWLRCFHQFVPSLWQTGTVGWNRPHRKGGSFCSDEPLPDELHDPMTCRPLSDSPLGFSYCIDESLSRFSIRFFWNGSSLAVDRDDKFLLGWFRKDAAPPDKVDAQAVIRRVIERRLLHPGLHIHLQGIGLHHHQRFDLCSCNPFVILYQIALQLCDYDSQKSNLRDIEMARISAAVAASMRTGAGIITPGILFGLS